MNVPKIVLTRTLGLFSKQAYTAGFAPVALEEHDVGPAEVAEVVGDRRADDATADAEAEADAAAAVTAAGSTMARRRYLPRNLSKSMMAALGAVVR